ETSRTTNSQPCARPLIGTPPVVVPARVVGPARGCIMRGSRRGDAGEGVSRVVQDQRVFAPSGQPRGAFLLFSHAENVNMTASSAALPQPSGAPALPAAWADASSLWRQIGDTPLLRLRRVARHLPETVAVYAKAEYLNPGGSVKDRAALRMIREGLRTGALRPGKILIDATSGNTGIAYAMLGAALGVPVRLALPANASAERKMILRSYGAEVVLTDPMEGTDGAQRWVKEQVAAHPDRYFYPDQYNND